MDNNENTNKSKSFIQHVFAFDNDSKSELLNIIQYSTIAILPVILMNKLMQKYVPEADENKHSVEIFIEIVIQIIFMFILILFIHRIITYIPTYSGDNYDNFSVTNIVLSMLVIILSLQTKLGEKVSILFDRTKEYISGSSNNNKKNNKNQTSNQPQQNPTNNVTNIMSLPSSEPQTQQSPNFNNMYQQQDTPLIGASMPTTENFEPMAANSFSSSSFAGW